METTTSIKAIYQNGVFIPQSIVNLELTIIGKIGFIDKIFIQKSKRKFKQSILI